MFERLKVYTILLVEIDQTFPAIMESFILDKETSFIILCYILFSLESFVLYLYIVYIYCVALQIIPS